MSISVAAISSILIPILAKSGANLLAKAVGSKSPMAGRVVEKIGEALGADPTPAAIEKKYNADPDAAAEAIREVEESDPELWKTIANADTVRAAIFAGEHQEGFYAWGWRPAFMWLLGVLWAWTAVALALGYSHIDFATLLSLTGIYTALYMGGHTAKAVWGKPK